MQNTIIRSSGRLGWLIVLIVLAPVAEIHWTLSWAGDSLPRVEVALRDGETQPAPRVKPARGGTDISSHAFEAATHYLLENGFATEADIARYSKSLGKDSVIRYARKKGWNPGTSTRETVASRRRCAAGADSSAGRPFLGIVPLTDLAGGSYKGHPGGLYPGGGNTPPQDHLRAALRQAAGCRPLDPDGRPSDDGRIVLISNGMSNTTQEFSAFVAIANQDKRKNPRLVIVDCAQGGMEASMWADPTKGIRRKKRSPWDEQDRRLRAAGVTARQVQVVWIKQARARPESLGEFPGHAEALRRDLGVVVVKLKARFPNLRLAYLSSRIYAGYATSRLNPEPYAYESAFSVRWLIEDQIKGKPSLNHDPARGAVKAPVLLWGPYLWADGVTGRKIDDLIWKREDLGGDGTHPSMSGRQKVARQLLKFFTTDPTARIWFTKETQSRPLQHHRSVQ